MSGRENHVLMGNAEAPANKAAPFPRPSGLPADFIARPDGIYYCIEADAGSADSFLCSPLAVLARTRDANGMNWGLVLEIADPDGRSHVVDVPSIDLSGNTGQLRKRLASAGAKVAFGRQSNAMLAKLLQEWHVEKRLVTTNRAGWAFDCRSFVMGSGRILGDQGIRFTAGNLAPVASEMRSSGTLADWHENVAGLCSGNPLMMVSVSLAFAGALLEPLGLEGGGLHLRGRSSCGKSTIQRVAASVWGGPGFATTWRATSSGLEGIAAACNSSLLVLDELGQIAAQHADEAAYMLANGRGKARADTTGASARAQSWRLMVLSSGEISLAQKLAESGRRAMAGQNVRLLDIEADARPYGAFDTLHGHPDGACFSQHLKAMSAKFHGVAGVNFVETLLAKEEKVRKAAPLLIGNFRKAAVARYGKVKDGLVQRAVDRLALCAMAGELAARMTAIGWDKAEPKEAALEVLGIWLDGLESDVEDEADASVARTRAFLTAYGSSRFAEVGKSPVQANTLGWRDAHYFYLKPEAWREAHDGHNPICSAHHLAEAGLLVRGEGSNLARKLPRAVEAARERAYTVRAQILNDHEPTQLMAA